MQGFQFEEDGGWLAGFGPFRLIDHGGEWVKRKVENVTVCSEQAAKVRTPKDVEEDRKERGFSA